MTAPQQQKLKVSGPVVVTANRLGDGAVVYLMKDGCWSTDLDDAVVATGAPEAGRLLARAAGDETHAIGAYVAPVDRRADGCLTPANLRERIRRNGPTFALPAKTMIGNAHVQL
ncbi:MAG TPA: DUF2849 domain-containing protein [Rhizomicrobium sp.]|jgi:hypothetical protein